MGGDDDLDSARQDWSNGGYVDRWPENMLGIMNILCLLFRVWNITFSSLFIGANQSVH